jgi:hypothetical protein
MTPRHEPLVDTRPPVEPSNRELHARVRSMTASASRSLSQKRGRSQGVRATPPPGLVRVSGSWGLSRPAIELGGDRVQPTLGDLPQVGVLATGRTSPPPLDLYRSVRNRHKE